MTIFLMELKKIWRLPIVILIGLFMLGNYKLTTDYYSTIPVHQSDHEIILELNEHFGKTLEENELPQAKEMLGELHKELDEIIQNHEDYETNKVKDFATFKAIEEQSWERPSPENDQALGNYMYDNDIYYDLILKEQSFSYMLNIYEEKMEDPTAYTYSDLQEEYAVAQWESGKGRSLVPYYVEYMTQNTVCGMFIHATLYMMLLLLPTVVRDRKNKISELQWSSAVGRKILSIQYLAHWFTALVFILPIPLVVLNHINVNEIMFFWEHSMLYFFHGTIYLLDFTLGQLVWCYLIFCIVASFVMSGFIFLLSRYSKNYPSLLLKAVPIMYFIYTNVEAWSELFSVSDRQIGLIFLPWSPWLEVYLLIACLLIVGVITFFMFKREKTIDL